MTPNTYKTDKSNLSAKVQKSIDNIFFKWFRSGEIDCQIKHKLTYYSGRFHQKVYEPNIPTYSK